jgi:hypothetical protein
MLKTLLSLGAVCIPLFLASAAISTATPHASVATTIYYLPFNTETYSPVTTSSIECAAKNTWIVSDYAKLKELSAILDTVDNESSLKFDANRVRVKIVKGFQVTYLDANGVANDQDRNSKINKTAFSKLLTSLGIGTNQRSVSCRTS